MKNRPKVYCIWHDAKSSTPGWVAAAELPIDLATCHTLGFVAHEDKEKITIISSYNDEEDVSQGTTIPKAWIISLKCLKSNGDYK